MHLHVHLRIVLDELLVDARKDLRCVLRLFVDERVRPRLEEVAENHGIAGWHDIRPLETWHLLRDELLADVIEPLDVLARDETILVDAL